MKTFLGLLLAIAVSCSLPAAGQSSNEQTATTFREPFTLKLRVDKDHYYEQHFDKVPYVAENDVYLFVDDHFGINLTDNKGKFLTVTYQPDIGKADLQLGFKQEKTDKGMIIMMLTIQNKLNHEVSYEALMTVPQKKEVLDTNVLPVEAQLVNYESWPHPIVQLVLRNFRFSNSSGKSEADKTSRSK